MRKTITLPVSLSVDVLLGELDPHIRERELNAAMKAVARERQRQSHKAHPAQPLTRDQPSDNGLISAVHTTTRALHRYEGSVGTRDERRALRALISACEGLRKASKPMH